MADDADAVRVHTESLRYRRQRLAAAIRLFKKTKQEREDILEGRERALSQHAHTVATQEHTLTKREDALAQQEQAVTQREAELEERVMLLNVADGSWLRDESTSNIT